ncbi:MAG: hypothetical protein HY237_10505 [Acidobacteria bacterium]|nr:hypothetical protein [Acidobacteriota bacterium]
MKGAPICVLALLSFAATAAADEIRLKDGTKIIGTIVGFQDGKFTVQTSYGFALVRKDRIEAIIPSESEAEPKTEPKPAAKKDAEAGKPATQSAAASAAPAPKREIAPPPTRVAAARAPKKETPPPAAPAVIPASQPVSMLAAPAPVATPPPPVIHEEVRGNLYINHTYGFRMYKPPGWHVIEGAQKTLPTAIVAMGTGDETTLLVIGRERMKDSLEAQAAATERQLREIYQNYRRLSEQRSKIAGLAALERRYRGTVDGHDWSGVVLSLARGNEVFTILGMTYADSDLIQIQENVIAKAIASLEFTTR